MPVGRPLTDAEQRRCSGTPRAIARPYPLDLYPPSPSLKGPADDRHGPPSGDTHSPRHQMMTGGWPTGPRGAIERRPNKLHDVRPTMAQSPADLAQSSFKLQQFLCSRGYAMDILDEAQRIHPS